MADLPQSRVAVDTSGALAVLGDLFLIAFCAPKGPVLRPQVYGQGKAVLQTYGDCRGTELCATFMRKTDKPVIAVALPVVTPGSVVNINRLGLTGQSAITVAPLGNGPFDDLDIVVQFVKGGTVGQ